MNLTIAPSVLQDTVAALDGVAQLWLNPNHAWRKEAVTAIQVATGLSRLKIEAALAAAFEELRGDKILSFCAGEPVFQQPVQAPKKVLHVLAGNVFTSFLPGAVTTLLLGAECHLKPSVQEPVFSVLWQRSVEHVEPALGDRIRVVRWENDLLNRYPAVVAYGSDGTLQALREKIAPDCRFVGYGHKLSVAVLWKEALTPEAFPAVLDRLERDVAPFDLEGCLSPRCVYVEGEDSGLFEQLFARVNVMPDIKRFESWDELKADLQDYRSHLSALGYAGPAARIEALQPELRELGFSRICALGEMQRPPLTWRNGGISLADELVGR